MPARPASGHRSPAEDPFRRPSRWPGRKQQTVSCKPIRRLAERPQSHELEMRCAAPCWSSARFLLARDSRRRCPSRPTSLCPRSRGGDVFLRGACSLQRPPCGRDRLTNNPRTSQAAVAPLCERAPRWLACSRRERGRCAPACRRWQHRRSYSARFPTSADRWSPWRPQRPA